MSDYDIIGFYILLTCTYPLRTVNGRRRLWDSERATPHFWKNIDRTKVHLLTNLSTVQTGEVYVTGIMPKTNCISLMSKFLLFTITYSFCNDSCKSGSHRRFPIVSLIGQSCTCWKWRNQAGGLTSGSGPIRTCRCFIHSEVSRWNLL